MAIFGKDREAPATNPSTAAADATEQNIQVAESAVGEKNGATELPIESDDSTKNIDKKKAQPGFGNYIRVLSYGTPLDMFFMAVSAITSIGAGMAFPLLNIVFGQLVGEFTAYFVPNPTVTRQQFQAAVNKNTLYLVYIFIAKFFLSYISLFTIRISGLRISANLRLAYLRATFAQPVSTIDTISPGKISTRITTSSNTIQLAISQHFAMLFQSATFIIGLYVVSFIKSWLLTFVASIALPFILIVYGAIIPPFISIHKKTEEIQEEASALAFEMFSSIRIVAAFGAEKRLGDQHADLLDKAAKNEKRTGPIMGLMMAPSMLATYGIFGLTFWFGIRQYTRGHIDDIGQIIVVLFSVMMAVMSIGRLASPIMAITKASSAATKIFETIDAHVPDTGGFKDPDVAADADIRLENVAFSYPSRPDVQILDGLNLGFEAGKVTAIVGPSGSGKSTVVGLLQRWYDLNGTTAEAKPIKPENTTTLEPDSAEKEKKKKKSKSSKDQKKEPAKKGEDDDQDEEPLGPNTCTGSIKIGGTDLRSVDLKWWRAQIGLVQQEPFLFNDTIFNNVAYGLCGTKYEDLSKEQKTVMVEEACKEAYADEFIARLPESYETFVGESGIKLSGGQRQRIAIARSIIKNPPILILDEATSSIDVRTERIVQKALERVSKDRTTIVIAHRLSTIKRADKIVVLRKGMLIEEGSHESLLKIENGVYSGLVHAQELATEAEAEDEDASSIHKVKTTEIEPTDTVDELEGRASQDEPKYKEQGLVMGFGRLLAEQRHHSFLYTIAVIGILGAGAVYPIQAYIFANVVQVFTYVDDFPKLEREGNFWAGMFGVEAAGVGVAYFALGWAMQLIANAITRYYRQEYLENMIRKRIPFFDTEGHSAGSLTSRLSSDTTQIQQLMSTEMSMAFIAVVNLVGSTIIAFVYGWKLSLVGLFCALPPILAAGYFRIRLEMQFEKMTAAVFEDSSQFATEAVGGFRTVLSLIMEDMIGDRYKNLLDIHVKKAFGSAKWGTLVFALSDSVEMACMALAFWYGGTLLASREYEMMDFFVIYIAVVQGAIAAGMWFSFAPNMAQAGGAANRILSMRTPNNVAATNFDALNSSEGGASVEFRNVSFTYKTREVPVLSKLNLKVQPGQFAALVGASGCGKSTTISLLERFYDADSGHILFNHQEISSLDTAEVRKQMSLVSQEPTLYEGTIRDNVALSVDSATDEEIHKVCADAQIHEFITSLPDGYNTRLGPKGMSLSGGQKQRLSLARALLRQPQLLLLDEATSSLDSESEKLVQEAIERAASGSGRTVIAVAHRLATIQKADVIFVLGSGKVLEQGDHQSLLKKKGVYYQMCQAQALDK